MPKPIQSMLCYLIDDDPDEKFIFEAALDDLGIEAAVVWRANGAQALEELRQGLIAPDYIFLDINMPRIDGWQCLEAIRAMSHLVSTPVAMYSTASLETLPNRPMPASGTAAYIRKTPSLEQLVKALREFFQKYSN